MIKMRGILYFLAISVVLINYSKADNSLNLIIDSLDNPSPGYLFSSFSSEGKFFVIDNSGDEIYKKNIEKKIGLLTINFQNGLITFFSEDKFFAMNQDYQLVDSFEVSNGYSPDPHDLLLLSNGNYILIGTETRSVDMSKIVTGGYQNASVIGNVIQEFDKNKNLLFEWKSLDHFNITDVCSDVSLTLPVVTTTHMNSVCVDNDGNLLASNRDFDEITKINRKTGEVIWRLGGKECKNNQFKFLNDTVDGFWGFSHQHSVSSLPNGHILILDNGNLKPNPYSRAVEYKVDESNKTVEKVWEYKGSGDITAIQQGSVQRLPDGNTMIGWGANNKNILATCVHPDGSVALQIRNFGTYSVYKYVFKEESLQKLIDTSGLYNFSDDSNKTNVRIRIDSINNKGFFSVEKHYYQPHGMMFAGQIPYSITQTRWTTSFNGKSKISGVIKFDTIGLSLSNTKEAIIYYRPIEGKSRFIPLNTTYNEVENCLEAEFKATGEFILCNVVPLQPLTLIYPRDNDTGIVAEPELSWQPMPFDASYRIQVSGDSNFSLLNIDTILFNHSWIKCPLDYEHHYFWRVKAIYEGNETPWTPIYTFMTMKDTNMKSPSLLYPPDGDSLVPVSGVLQWEKVDSAKSYKVELAFDSEFLLPCANFENIETTYVNYYSLMFGTQYYWHVSATDGVKFSPWSETRMFKTDNEQNVDLSANQNKFCIQYSDEILKISFYDKYGGYFKFYLYDMLGEEVSFLNGYYNDSNLTLDLNNLDINSGIYFYRIIIDGQCLVGRIMKQL